MNGVGNGQHRMASGAVVGRCRVTVVRHLVIGMKGACVALDRMDGCRIALGMVAVGVAGISIREIEMVVVADVKMEVEEAGAHFAVVMPVVRSVQTEA